MNEQSDSSRCSTLDVYDNGFVDSTWLASFCQRVSEFQFQKGRVLFECDAGQWIAYSVGFGFNEQSIHKLVEVNYRFEVANLIRALKIDA
jgi:hypothetical protein